MEGLRPFLSAAAFDEPLLYCTLECFIPILPFFITCFFPLSGVVCCGLQHITFFGLQGRNISRRKAVLGDKGKKQAFLSIGWSGRDAVIGTGSGQLYHFEGPILARAINAHKGGVTLIRTTATGM